MDSTLYIAIVVILAAIAVALLIVILIWLFRTERKDTVKLQASVSVSPSKKGGQQQHQVISVQQQYQVKGVQQQHQVEVVQQQHQVEGEQQQHQVKGVQQQHQVEGVQQQHQVKGVQQQHQVEGVRQQYQVKGVQQQQGQGWHKFQYIKPAISNPGARRQELGRRPKAKSRQKTQYQVVNEFQRHKKPDAKSDYPPYFLSLESDTSLPENAKRSHIFTGSSSQDSIMRGALAISEKRAQLISKNTVFCAPKKWHAWKTKQGPRIVSSERVVTVQCERRGGQGRFVGAMVGKKYAIFRHDGHLMARQSLLNGKLFEIGIHVPGGAATCSEGCVVNFLKVPLACWCSSTAQQPGELSENILQNLSEQVAAPFGIHTGRI